MSKPASTSPKQHPNGSTIVIKLGTSSILSEQNLQPRLGLLANLVETCVFLRSAGHKVLLVSSGAIGMGMRRMSLLDGGLHGRWGKKPKTLNEKQALAAIGQGHLIALWDSLFSRLNQPISQILLTRGDLADVSENHDWPSVPDSTDRLLIELGNVYRVLLTFAFDKRSRYLNASSTLTTLLNCGVIPIINENDTLSVAEIKFGDNDTLSAVTAAMCHADYLFLMTDVDCLYTENPRSNPAAKMVKVVFDIEGVRKIVSTASLGSSLGTGGMETKLIAAELATAAGVSTIICNGLKPQYITAMIADIQSTAVPSDRSSPALLVSPESITSGAVSDAKPIYTVFLPHVTPLTSRKFWVAHGLVPKGSVVIDKGAYRAIGVESNGGRLLPAGLVKVCGTFAVGQAVSIMVPAAYVSRSRAGSELGQKTPSDAPVVESLATCPPVSANDPSEDLVEVGRGLVNYNSYDMDKLKGLHSSAIELVLGHIDSEHVIESIVLFKPSSPC